MTPRIPPRRGTPSPDNQALTTAEADEIASLYGVHRKTVRRWANAGKLRTMPSSDPGDSQTLTAGEVARLYGVHIHTVTRWADAGKLDSFRTPGGHRRFYASALV